MPLVTGLLSRELGKIIDNATAITDYIIGNENGQNGGVLCIADRQTGTPLFMCMFGILKTEKLVKYTGYAIEKAKRLAENVSDLTSMASRDPDAGKYGGAIRGSKYILSFSGFKEVQDEAAMLVLEFSCFLVGDMQLASTGFIECCEANEYFSTLEQGSAWIA